MDNPVEFVAIIQGIEMLQLPSEATVVINERTGVIVIGSDVQIRPVAVTLNNIRVEAGKVPSPDFIPLNPQPQEVSSAAKLKSLVDALNAVKVPPRDIIDVIKELHRGGYLYGQLILE